MTNEPAITNTNECAECNEADHCHPLPTLRDSLAAAALVGVLGQHPMGEPTGAEAAELAYMIADEMMIWRHK